MLLTCDVKGLSSKSCALHKLRWKSVDPWLDENEARRKRNVAEDEKKKKSSAPAAPPPRKPSPVEQKVEEDDDEQKVEEDDVEALVMSMEPDGRRRCEASAAGGSGSSEDEAHRLKRAKSDESMEVRRDPVGIEEYVSFAVGKSKDMSGGSAASSSAGGGGGEFKVPGLMMRRTSSGASSIEGGGGWGFYEDFDSFLSRESVSRLDVSHDVDRVTPEYVLEDSLASQALWHSTAGKRPPQPTAERKRLEALWERNFEESQVEYDQQRQHQQQQQDVWTKQKLAGSSSVPLLREQSPFGTSVTKSWQCPACGELSSMMVHIPKYQVVKEGSFDIHAEYLVVVRLRFVTFGLWRRYSHFQRLADKIVSENRPIDFENTLGSWRCVKRRQRWFRCLDKDYITLKCFLLERFLHDAVFESDSSELFHDFLEIFIPDESNDENFDQDAGHSATESTRRAKKEKASKALAPSNKASASVASLAHH